MNPEFEVKFYDHPNGSFPAYDFIETQPPKMNAKIYRTIDLLEEKGPMLRMPYSKRLKDGIFELRVDVGSDSTRVLYFFIEGKKIILTHGFVKETRKTPQEQINCAEKYRKDYLARHSK